MYEGQTFKLQHLGTVHTRTVYAYYDGPILFSCESDSGQRLLASWVDRTEEGDDWLFLPVSTERLRAIEDGSISLRDALLAPESESVWQVAFSAVDGASTVCLVPSDEVPPKYLPEEDSFLPSVWQPTSGDEEDLFPSASLVAARLATDVVDLRLYAQSKGREGVPSAIAGRVLSALQRLVEVAAYRWEGARAKIPQAVREKTELRFVAAAAGSLRLRLVGSSDLVLLGESEVGQALSSVVRLIEMKTDKTGLSEMSKEIGPRAMAQWEGFARRIGQDLGQLELAWTSPAGQTKKASITGPEAMSTYNLMRELVGQKTETFELQGVLVGGDTKAGSFHLVVSDDVDYKGTLGPGVSESALTLDRQGTAILEVRYTVVGPTAEEKTEFSLLDWQEAPRVGGSSFLA